MLELYMRRGVFME